MSNTTENDLSGALADLAAAAHTAAAGSGAPSGSMVHALFGALDAAHEQLRTLIAHSDDPRLALELAGAAQRIGDQAVRMSLVAADRIEATAAHTLSHDQLERLRTEGPRDEAPIDYAASRPSFKSPADLHSAWTGSTFAAAQRCLLDAHDLIGRRDHQGNTLPARFGSLARRFLDPAYSPQTVRTISQKLSRVEPKDQSFEGIRTEAVLTHPSGRKLEELLARALDEEFTDAQALQKAAGLIRETVDDPDSGRKANQRRGLFALKQRNEHCREFMLRTSITEGELIDSLIAESNNPRTEAGQAARTNPDGAHPADESQDCAPMPDFLPESARSARWEPEAEQAEAAPAERALNALLLILRTVDPYVLVPDGSAQQALFDLDDAQAPEDADAASTPEDEADEPAGPAASSHEPREDAADHTGGSGAVNGMVRRKLKVRPQIVVHMYLEDLRRLAAAHAETAHAVHLPPGQLRQALCQADLLPAVFSADGALLDYGRSQRLVPPSLQKAVLARDRRCLVPGCTAPVEHLSFHHVQPFAQGGATSIENIVPACTTHHTDMDLEIIKVYWVQALPWVLLPAEMDPEQRLRRNYVPQGLPAWLPPPATC